ncbi:ParB-like nuclease domain containing protein [Natrarchaeobaculum sulfurireducens]|uniref:ParB-like nuclease domain containing protein n=1 Tax=Natrarchaeobaculum sulfurireducens TaxID=2044521 RepID=A0A346PCE4_9EURY|nr:ParB-like nuclease domain containing protein [Natrarchaeobaculum sulfurireducens]
MQRTRPRAIEQRFVDELEWDETVLADKYDTSTLEDRGAEIDRLYKHIRDGGYKSQRQLLEESPKTAWEGLNDAMHPLANEIAVDIGRDGELLWNMCGQHRLAIANVLEIDRIPVQVFRRHAEWQAIRDRARRGEEIPEDLHDHPDLVDVLGDE